MRKCDRTQHFLFSQLIGLGFDHHNCVFGPGHHQIKPLIRLGPQVIHIFNFGVQNILAVDKADAATCDWAHERRARDCQRGRGGNHRHDIGVVYQIMAEHGAHHQNFVFKPINEQRTQGAVNQPCGQCFFFRGAGFSFEKATGDFTRGIVFFLIVNGQGKKVLPGLLGFCKGHIGHNRGFTQGGNHRPISLARHFPSFQCEGVFTPFDRFFRYVKHYVSYNGGRGVSPCAVCVRGRIAPVAFC